MCVARFTWTDHLTRHIRIHTKSFVCNECRTRYTYKRSLLEHHRFMHSEERPYVCHECGKGYTSKQALITHTLVYTERRPFACDQCEKKSVEKQHLIWHKGTHFGERPFVCSKCGKRFAHNCSLQIGKRFCRKFSPDITESCTSRKHMPCQKLKQYAEHFLLLF